MKENERITPEEELEKTTSETEQETEGAEAAPEPAELEEELDELDRMKLQFVELTDQYKRILAEYDNFRKRTAKERENIYPEAKSMVLTGFLPVLDNFERAMQTPCSDPEFLKGMEMIYQNFRECFTKLGVEEFGEAGDTFDPQLHNAVMHVEDDAYENGTICEVFQHGYRLGDKVLRYAMVKVAN